MLPPKEDGSSDHHTQYEGAEQDILAAKSLHSFDLNFSSQELQEESTSTSKGIIKEDDNNSLGFGFLDKKKVAVSSNNNNPFDFDTTTGTTGGASSPPRASFEREEDEEEDDDDLDEEEEDNEEVDSERTSNSLITLESSSETQIQPNNDEGQRVGETPNKDPISKEDPMGGSTTTVDETSSSGGGGSGSATAIEVVEVLKNLEDYKTPDPVELESSIVRANFVDFSPDDDNNGAMLGDSPLIGTAQITNNPEDEDESKEFSLSLNPDLPKIRAQQIQNWLEFEKEHEIKEDSLEEGMKAKSDECGNNGGVDGGDGVGGVGGVGGGANPPYDLDSLSEATAAGGTTTTTVTDADGVQRRVRFLTDPHGNILISVYLTKLVQFILSILKLVSAGYLDFTTTPPPPPTTKSILEHSSSSSPTSPDTPASSSSLINAGATPLLDQEDEDASEIDPLLSSSFNFLCHYNETDDYVIPNGDNDVMIPLPSEDGEEQIEAVHQANGDGTYGAALLEAQLVNIDLNKLEALNVEVKASQSPSGELDSLLKNEETAKSNDENNNIDEAVKEEKKETGESEKTGEVEIVPGEQTGASGESKKKKVVSADPSLSNFDEGEDIGSDSETMSTSSCSSMIEVVPKTEDGETELEFIKSDDHDENNNEMKMDVLNLANAEEAEVQEKTLSSLEIQPEKEEKEIKSVIEVKGEDQFAPSAPPAAAIVDVTLKNEDGQELVQTQAPVEIESKHGVSSVLLNASPTQGDNSPTVAELEQELKFNPIIEQEEVVVNVATASSPVDQMKLVSSAPPSPPLKPQAVKEDINGNQVIHVTSPMMHVEGGFQLPPMGDEPEKQLESLCIQEEPISAVALTIAKWESLSKKQAKPKEPVERTNSAPKGNKLVLPTSYTGNGGPQGNNAMNITSIAQHQIHGKPVQVLPTGCNLNGILQSKMLGLNNGNNPSVPGSPTSRSESPANNKLSAAGWSAFNNNNNNQNAKVPTEIKTPNEEEEAIYAQPNAHGGSLTTSLANPSSILKSYPKPNSKGEIINWFKEGEIHRSGILLSYGQTNSHQSPTPLPQNVTSPVIVSWFFGLITRQQAEEFLHDQPNGTFLVRISTRIWGYTLSYQSNNKTKHFLISAINPAVASTLSAGTEPTGKGHAIQKNPPTPTGKQQMLFPFSPGGRYAFIGTNMTPYTTLASLIRHHSHAPITKAGGEKLVTPCPGGPKISGIEYVFK